ncbi:hypothetical protein C1645_842767 [Glomus cerebriforme]|uniref:Uncharacterized protein n=1 Tax=Glomus cerebriforme TaxID=658196 RepID=A0A397S3W5_9GLOM|nr:hypothetical protein C1645_842767 [Glomus cerebriforme]
MVEIRKIDNQHIEVDKIRVNISEYNTIYDQYGYGVGSKIQKASYGNISGLDDSFFADVKCLYGRFENGKFISMKEGEAGGSYPSDDVQVEEIRKNRGISPNLYADIKRKEENSSKPNQGSFGSISIIALKKHLKIQRDETGQTPGDDYIPPQEPDNREERNKKWKEISDLRESVWHEIENALSVAPTVSSSELTKPN